MATETAPKGHAAPSGPIQGAFQAGVVPHNGVGALHLPHDQVDVGAGTITATVAPASIGDGGLPHETLREMYAFVALARALDTPIATGEMLTRVDEHWQLLQAGGADILQPDAPRVGGVTPFLRVAALADHSGVPLAPHFVMELHIHLAAAQPREGWVEHFDWLEPLFNERLTIADGRMQVPTGPGLSLSVSEEAAGWVEAREEVAL